MNLGELNSEFEIVFEDLATNGSKGLDMYEKSVCFTNAQEQLVRALAQENSLVNISNCIVTKGLTSTGAGHFPTSIEFMSLQDSGEEPILILDRYLDNGDINEYLPVLEVPMGVITSMLKSPYKYPRKNLAYVVVGENTDNVFPPLNYSTTQYLQRFVKLPTPVILEQLTGSDSINGLTTPTLPLINSPIHRTLVEIAVQFAIKVYVGIPEKSVDAQN